MLPKASGGDHGNQYTGGKNDTAVDFAKPTKLQAVEALGFTPKQAERFETLADHPEEVAQAKAEARENDDLPTRTAVLSLIKRKQENAERERQEADVLRAAAVSTNALRTRFSSNQLV